MLAQPWPGVGCRGIVHTKIRQIDAPPLCQLIQVLEVKGSDFTVCYYTHRLSTAQCSVLNTTAPSVANAHSTRVMPPPLTNFTGHVSTEAGVEQNTTFIYLFMFFLD